MLSEMFNSIRTTLNVEGNIPGNNGAQALAEARKTNMTLTNMENKNMNEAKRVNRNGGVEVLKYESRNRKTG